MYPSLVLPASLGLLSLAAAQAAVSAPAAVPSSSTCDDMAVLDACLQSTEAIAASYASTDYIGLCSAWQSVLVYVPLLHNSTLLTQTPHLASPHLLPLRFPLLSQYTHG